MLKPLIYVDTDVGLGTPGAEIDDASALVLLMTSPGLQLLGAGSVFGNVPIADALVNLSRLKSYFAHQECKIGTGAEQPLVEGLEWFTEWQSGYGKTLPFEVPGSLPSSTRLMIDLVREHPHQVTLLSIGPMTNLALAARLEPDFIPLVKEVVAMGGSFGKQPEASEFNSHCDPEAAHIVLNAGWNLTLFGLNITRQMKFTRQEFTALKGTHPATMLLKKMAQGWIDRVEKMGWEEGGCSLHDAVTAAYLVKPSLFQFRKIGISVELHDISKRGVVRFNDHDLSLPQARVATQVDVEGCHDLIWSYIQKCEE